MRPRMPGHAAARPASFAIIIGAMKCGTTSLFDLLAQHPAICASSEKEPDFFASVDDPREAWSEYLRLWNWEPRHHEVALEASTSCTKHPWVQGVPEKIARSPGERFKLIYMMRDPVRRIESQVRHSLYEGWGRSLDEDGFTEDLLDFSRYAAQLDRYTAIFSREDLLLLTLDEMRRSPHDVLRRACAFLGVSQDREFTAVEVPRNAGDFYTVPRFVSAAAKSRFGAWAARRVLTRNGKQRLRRWLARGGRGREEALGRWRLSPEEEERVRAGLAEDMARLREHYGVEAPWIPPTGAPAPTPR